MNILALDLGTKTGWAISQEDGIISGVENFQGTRFEGGGMCYLRFKKFLTNIKNKCDGLDAVFYEEVRNHTGRGKGGRVTFNIDAAHKYGGFMATLAAWCEHHEIPYSAIPVGTIKRHITGKGNANKDLVIERVKERGFNPEDDNEADAIAMLDYVLKREIVDE